MVALTVVKVGGGIVVALTVVKVGGGCAGSSGGKSWRWLWWLGWW